MKFKVFILLLMLTYGERVVGQYQNMLGTSNEWYQLFIGLGWSSTNLWKNTSDSVIRTHVYKKIESFPLDSSGIIVTNYGGFIREDTAARKIYYINCNSWGCDTLELLLYDFSKSIGDTIVVNELYEYTPA